VNFVDSKEEMIPWGFSVSNRKVETQALQAQAHDERNGDRRDFGGVSKLRSRLRRYPGVRVELCRIKQGNLRVELPDSRGMPEPMYDRTLPDVAGLQALGGDKALKE